MILVMLAVGRFLRIFHLHVFIDDLAKFSRDIVSLQSNGFAPIDVNWRYRALSRSRKADADIGMLAFAGAIDDASHHRQGHVLYAIIFFTPYQHLLANISLYAFRQLLKISAGCASTSGACRHERHKGSQPRGLQDFLGNDHFAGTIAAGLGSKRYPNGIAYAIQKQYR